MDDRKRLVSGFLGFLAEEVKANRPSEELTESLEVAMQCLESAYNIAPQDVTAAGEVPLLSLLQKQIVRPLFPSLLGLLKCRPSQNPFAGAPEATGDAKDKAEECKMIGNNMVKEDNHLGAIEQYTRYYLKLDFKAEILSFNLFSGQLCMMRRIPSTIATELLPTIN